MIILVAYFGAVVTIEHECDSPVSIDSDCPLPPAAPLELVETKTWGVEVTNIRCCIEPCQYSPNLGHMIRFQTSFIPSLEESFQTSMLETDNHQTSVTCNVSGVKNNNIASSNGWALRHCPTAGRVNGIGGGGGIRARRDSAGDRKEPTHGLPERSPVFKTVAACPDSSGLGSSVYQMCTL